MHSMIEAKMAFALTDSSRAGDRTSRAALCAGQPAASPSRPYRSSANARASFTALRGTMPGLASALLNTLRAMTRPFLVTPAPSPGSLLGYACWPPAGCSSGALATIAAGLSGPPKGAACSSGGCSAVIRSSSRASATSRRSLTRASVLALLVDGPPRTCITVHAAACAVSTASELTYLRIASH